MNYHPVIVTLLLILVAALTLYFTPIIVAELVVDTVAIIK